MNTDEMKIRIANFLHECLENGQVGSFAVASVGEYYVQFRVEDSQQILAEIVGSSNLQTPSEPQKENFNKLLGSGWKLDYGNASNVFGVSVCAEKIAELVFAMAALLISTYMLSIPEVSWSVEMEAE